MARLDPSPAALAPILPARVPSRVFSMVEGLVLSVVLALAWKTWSACPPIPFADPDTWGYLNPALGWLSGLGFHQAGGRDWLYPALLALFLKTTGSFAGIIAWQKYLGLLAGIVMGVTWRSWVSLLPFSRGARFALSLLGAVPIYLQLINQQGMVYLLSLRPEAVLPLCVYAQLACVLGYAKFRWQTPRPLPSLLFGAATILFAYACFLLKPSWYLATATTCLPVCAGLFGQALSRKTRLCTPALGIVASLLVFWLPARLLFVRDGASVTLLPLALFCVHSPLIEKSFEARLATLPDSDPEKARLRHLDDVLKGEVRVAMERYRPYDVLRINPDYLLDSHVLNSAISEYAGADDRRIKDFCFRSYRDALLHDPGAYAKKVWLQFRWFLFPDTKTLFKDRGNLAAEYQLSAHALTGHPPAGLHADWQEAHRRYEQDLTAQVAVAATLEDHPRLTAFAKGVTRWVVWTEIAFLLALLATHVWSPLHRLRVAGWGAAFLFLAPLGNALGVCLVHALDIYRYRITLGGYLWFALTAMVAFLLVVVGQSVRQTLLNLRQATSHTSSR